MNHIIFCLFSACFILINGCQTGQTSSDPKIFAKKMAFPNNFPKGKEGVSVSDLRKRVKNLIAERKKSHKEDLSQLTYYHLRPQFFANLDDRGEVIEPLWLKFDDNYTYRYGIGNESVGRGIYHYASSDRLLFMVDDDPAIEPKLWEPLFNSEFVNFLGHPLIVLRDMNNTEHILVKNFASDSYINQFKTISEIHNGMQIKMVLEENQPK